jgi:hypothetical protein
VSRAGWCQGSSWEDFQCEKLKPEPLAYIPSRFEHSTFNVHCWGQRSIKVQGCDTKTTKVTHYMYKQVFVRFVVQSHMQNTVI